MITQSEGINVLLLFLLATLPYFIVGMAVVLIVYDVVKRKLRKVTVASGFIAVVSYLYLAAVL